MLSGARGYEKISNEPDDDSSILKLRVFVKEKCYNLEIEKTETILNLKIRIEQLTGIIASRQRLVYCGKVLTPDTLLISSFNIKKESTIHVFPIREALNLERAAAPSTTTPSSNVPINNSAISASSSLNIRIEGLDFAITPLHYDRTILTRSYIVKIWSVFLLLTCLLCLLDFIVGLALRNILSYGYYHCFVQIVGVLLSIVGIGVSRLGFRCTSTLLLEEVTLYLTVLTRYVIACIILRIFWIVDVYYLARTSMQQNNQSIPQHDDYANGHHDPTTPVESSTAPDKYDIVYVVCEVSHFYCMLCGSIRIFVFAYICSYMNYFRLVYIH